MCDVQDKFGQQDNYVYMKDKYTRQKKLRVIIILYF